MRVVAAQIHVLWSHGCRAHTVVKLLSAVGPGVGEGGNESRIVDSSSSQHVPGEQSRAEQSKTAPAPAATSAGREGDLTLPFSCPCPSLNPSLPWEHGDFSCSSRAASSHLLRAYVGTLARWPCLLLQAPNSNMDNAPAAAAAATAPPKARRSSSSPLLPSLPPSLRSPWVSISFFEVPFR